MQMVVRSVLGIPLVNRVCGEKINKPTRIVVVVLGGVYAEGLSRLIFQVLSRLYVYWGRERSILKLAHVLQFTQGLDSTSASSIGCWVGLKGSSRWISVNYIWPPSLKNFPRKIELSLLSSSSGNSNEEGISNPVNWNVPLWVGFVFWRRVCDA